MKEAKHQLCYWHEMKYIEERLTDNRPPAAYDPRKAHKMFESIDPTWAPGVTSGWLEEGVHPDHAVGIAPEYVPDSAVADEPVSKTASVSLLLEKSLLSSFDRH